MYICADGVLPQLYTYVMCMCMPQKDVKTRRDKKKDGKKNQLQTHIKYIHTECRIIKNLYSFVVLIKIPSNITRGYPGAEPEKLTLKPTRPTTTENTH